MTKSWCASQYSSPAQGLGGVGGSGEWAVFRNVNFSIELLKFALQRQAPSLPFGCEKVLF
jgi:hypothetical protein